LPKALFWVDPGQVVDKMGCPNEKRDGLVANSVFKRLYEKCYTALKKYLARDSGLAAVM